MYADAAVSPRETDTTEKLSLIHIYAIGTPYCVTVDHQTLEDNCVTLRIRDTMQQERVAISELNNIIADRVSCLLYTSGT